MKWWPGECCFGDMIRVNLGSIYHYGIFVNENRVIQFGLPPVPDNNNGDEIKVCVSDIETFSCGKIIEIAHPDRRELKTKKASERIVETAENRIGEGGYDMLNNNCEHFAYECYLGIKKSEQQESILKRWIK